MGLQAYRQWSFAWPQCFLPFVLVTRPGKKSLRILQAYRIKNFVGTKHVRVISTPYHFTYGLSCIIRATLTTFKGIRINERCYIRDGIIYLDLAVLDGWLHSAP